MLKWFEVFYLYSDVLIKKLSFHSQESHLEKLQKSKNNFVVQSTTTTSDDFDYRSILLWLSLGCLTVFIALRILRCLLTKSERQSEEYRLSRHHHEALSIDEDVKSTVDIK